MMKSKAGMALLGMGIGVGSAALYQNLKNGNIKKMVRKMNSAKTKAIDEMLEEIYDQPMSMKVEDQKKRK